MRELEIIQSAIAYLQKGFCIGSEAKAYYGEPVQAVDPYAVRFCAMGALRRSAHDLQYNNVHVLFDYPIDAFTRRLNDIARTYILTHAPDFLPLKFLDSHLLPLINDDPRFGLPAILEVLRTAERYYLAIGVIQRDQDQDQDCTDAVTVGSHSSDASTESVDEATHRLLCSIAPEWGDESYRQGWSCQDHPHEAILISTQ
jgi:hypothetical protein